MDSEAKARAEGISGLRQLADWLEANPSAGIPAVIMVTDYPWRRQQISELARLPGPWDKLYEDNIFTLRRRFGPAVEYRACTLRSIVCRKVVTGRRTVEAPALPALPARTVTEDIVEWLCDEPLLAPEKGE